jgi:hypothetical protein
MEICIDCEGTNISEGCCVDCFERKGEILTPLGQFDSIADYTAAKSGHQSNCPAKNVQPYAHESPMASLLVETECICEDPWSIFCLLDQGNWDQPIFRVQDGENLTENQVQKCAEDHFGGFYWPGLQHDTDAPQESVQIIPNIFKRPKSIDSITLNKGQTMLCPSCDGKQEGPVEDYTIPGRIGDESVADPDQCFAECDKYFTVMNNGDDTFTVTRVNKP